MRIFVVEDEEIHLEVAIMNIKKAGYELAGYCMNADEAFQKIKDSKPHIVLVDIALPGFLNGITLSEKINKELGIPHIFTTSLDDDEVIKQAVKTKPKAYLNKPISLGNLKAAIKIASENPTDENPENAKTKPQLIFTKIGDRLVKIPVDDIKYLKADGDNHTSVFTGNIEISCRTTIKQLLKELPEFFVQIHRSVVININFLDEINELNQVAIINKKELPIGRKYKKDLYQLLNKI